MLALVTKIILNRLLPKILKFHSKGTPGCQIVLLKKDESRKFKEFYYYDAKTLIICVPHK